MRARGRGNHRILRLTEKKRMGKRSHWEKGNPRFDLPRFDAPLISKILGVIPKPGDDASKIIVEFPAGV